MTEVDRVIEISFCQTKCPTRIGCPLRMIKFRAGPPLGKALDLQRRNAVQITIPNHEKPFENGSNCNLLVDCKKGEGGGWLKIAAIAFR